MLQKIVEIQCCLVIFIKFLVGKLFVGLDWAVYARMVMYFNVLYNTKENAGHNF
jgi:hypothetical protein